MSEIVLRVEWTCEHTDRPKWFAYVGNYRISYWQLDSDSDTPNLNKWHGWIDLWWPDNHMTTIYTTTLTTFPPMQGHEHMARHLETQLMLALHRPPEFTHRET